MISLGFLIKADSGQAQAALKGLESAVGASTSAIEGDFSKASSGITSKLMSLTPGFGMMAGAVMSVGGAMAALAMKSINAGDEMYLASKRTGMSVEALGGMKLAAKQAGLSFDTVERGLERMTLRLSPFSQQGKQGTEALQELGIQAMGANGKMRPMNDILDDMADKFSHMKDGTEKTALAMSIFGRSGAQLIPILDQGSAALRKLTDEEKNNSGMTQEVAQQDHILHDEVILLEDKFKGLTQQVGQLFVHALGDAVIGIRAAVIQSKILGDEIVLLTLRASTFTDKMLHQKDALAFDTEKMGEFKTALAANTAESYKLGTAQDSAIKSEKSLTDSFDAETGSTEKSTKALKDHIKYLGLEINKASEIAKLRKKDIEDNEKKATQQQEQINGQLLMKKFSPTMMAQGMPELGKVLQGQPAQLARARVGWADYTNAIRQGIQVTGGMSDAMGAMYNKVAQIAEAHQRTNTLQNQSNQAMQVGTRNTMALTMAQGASLAEGTAMFVKNKKAQAVINAIAQTAEGIAALAMIPPDPVSAALHFASAAMWGAIGGTAGGGGQGGGGGRGSANQGYGNSDTSQARAQQGVVGGGGMLSRGGGGGGNYHQSVVNIYGGQITDTNNLQNMVTMLNQGGSTGTVRMNVAGTSATIPTPAY